MMSSISTGSFGSTVLKHFLTSDIGEIRIISRDEKKQDMMRHVLQADYPEYAGKVQFYVGDVRNIDSVRDVMYMYKQELSPHRLAVFQELLNSILRQL